jgi:hypothetical protein
MLNAGIFNVFLKMLPPFVGKYDSVVVLQIRIIKYKVLVDNSSSKPVLIKSYRQLLIFLIKPSLYEIL